MLEDQLPDQLPAGPGSSLDGLRGRETRTVSYRMPRLPRGRYRAGPLRIRLTDPFHLVDLRRSFTATTEFVVDADRRTAGRAPSRPARSTSATTPAATRSARAAPTTPRPASTAPATTCARSTGARRRAPAR